MSWRKISPSWSSRTVPRKAARPPKLATPATVLAAEPPEVSLAGPMASYSRWARCSSMRVIPPFSIPHSSTNESSAWVMASTMALPRPTTS
jgi:hypothetical protein